MTDSVEQRPAPGGTATLAGRSVARIGYGAMRLVAHGGPGGVAWNGLDDDAAVALLHRAVESGVNHIDTADFYGGGHVNELLNTALAPYADVLIATKIGARIDPGGSGLVSAQKPAELRAAVEDNVRSLGTDHLPLVYLRRTDIPPGLIAQGDQRVPIDDQLAELIRLRDAGTIGAIGLGNITAETLRRVAPAGIASVQNCYSLVDRGDEPVLQACLELGIAWVPYFPLGGAAPGRPQVSAQPTVRQIAARLEVGTAAVGLAWLLQHAPNTLLIPGTANFDHLAENLAVGSLHLDEPTMATLDTLHPVAS